MAPRSQSNYPRRALLFAVASAACSAVRATTAWPEILPRKDGIDFSSAPPNLTTLGNNSLFTHWRPKAHFIAPNSWMNDPMTLWYKPDGEGGGKFKASYQAHPNHVQWGNISQASAVSDDLIHWKDVPSWKEDRLTLYPSQPNDRLGVFDGTMIPDKGYKGFPTLIYTGVKYLPTGWTIPYTPGTETQNLAWTEDGGVTWKKLESNPVIGGPPEGMNITAFRDPWLFQSPTLERLTASNPGTPTPPTTFNGTAPNATTSAAYTNETIKDPWFVTVSGGEKGVGPHLLLYRQASTDFTKWVYLGQIFQHEGNYSWSEWSGNWGWNFEVSTVLRLGTEGDQPGAGGRDFICMGTEGGRPDGWANHWPLWVRGNYSDAVQMVPEYAGVVDWGETYAFMSFPAPRKGGKDLKNQPSRQILFGWTYEDDNGYGVLAKGWQGAFTLPRDMFVKQWTVRDSRADEKGSWGVVGRSSSANTATLETLGTRPAEEVDALMNKSKNKWSEKSWAYKGSGNGSWAALSKQPKSRYYALSATLTFNSSATDAQAGFTIYRSPDGSEETHIYYDFAAETIRVDRSKSSLVTGFNLGPEAGKMRLWNVPSGKNGTKLESLNLQIFVDNSIVEIYANGVFAMTTRVYPWRDDSVGLGYYTSGSGSVKYSNVKVWEGLTNAWPERPANTSNVLVWDGPGLPWAGW